MWCMPHRLDLAVRKMSQSCPPAAQVIDILELVYKTYHYSPIQYKTYHYSPNHYKTYHYSPNHYKTYHYTPNHWCKLYELGAELDVAALSPWRAKGTRWSPHIQCAMAVMPRPAEDDAPGQYTTVPQHMEHFCERQHHAQREACLWLNVSGSLYTSTNTFTR